MSSTLACAVSIQPEEDELANTTVLFLQADRKRRREARLYTCRQLCSLFAQIVHSLRSVLVRRCIARQVVGKSPLIELTLLPALRSWN